MHLSDSAAGGNDNILTPHMARLRGKSSHDGSSVEAGSRKHPNWSFSLTQHDCAGKGEMLVMLTYDGKGSNVAVRVL